MTAYDKLCERFRRISTLQDARGILNWDMLTMMPKGAAESRGEQLATLEALAHEAMTDPRVGDWLAAAEASRDAYRAALDAAGMGAITTEIRPAGEFFYAEDYHQQYLSKNPNGYCGLGGTGVACPVGLGVTTED